MAEIAFRAGQIVDDAVSSDPDLKVEGPGDVIERFLRHEDLGRALLELELSVPTPGGWWTGRVPPFDEDSEPAMGRLPEIDGANVSALTILKDSPFGEIHRFRSFKDGQIISTGTEAVLGADVVVTCTYADFITLRQGAITFVEMYERGATIDGTELGKLSAFLGILDSRAFREATSRCCPNLNGLMALTVAGTHTRRGNARENDGI